MKLYPHWKTIVRKSWALRFMALGIAGEGAQAVLPLYVEDIPRGTFALLTVLAITAAMISRLIYQPDI